MKYILIALFFLPTLAQAQEKQSAGPKDTMSDWMKQAQEQTKILLDAVDKGRQEVAAHPDSADAHFHLAEALSNGPQKSDTPKEIANEYLQAISLKPDYAEAYFGISKAYVNLGKQDKALEAIEKAIQLKPNYADAYLYMGYYYLREKLDDKVILPETEKDLKLAKKAFKNALQIKVDFGEAYVGLGTASMGLKEYDEALEAFRQAVHLNPYDITAHIGIGELLIKSGNREAATQEYESLISISDKLELQLKESGENSSNPLINPFKYMAEQLLEQIQSHFDK